MKQVIFVIFLISAVCVAAFAQITEPQFVDIFPLAEYEKVPAKVERAILDVLFDNLFQNKDFECIIILNFDKNTSKDKKIKRLKDIVKMINSRNFDINRITFIISTDEDSERTTLYVLPENDSFFNGLAEGNKTIKAEEFKQQINKIFPKK